MNDDGTMARLPDLKIFAKKHGLHIVTIADLIQWRLRNERLVVPEFDAKLPVSGIGTFDCRVYRSMTDGSMHLAVWSGELTGEVLVRVQSSDPVGDVFRAESSDAWSQLGASLEQIRDNGGVLLYMHLFGGRSAESLVSLLKAHLLPADRGSNDDERIPPKMTNLRDFGTGAQILLHLGLRKLRLLTNNPRKIVGLEGYGLEVVDRVPLTVETTDANRALLAGKVASLGHIIKIVE
jgi:3,4-dihydroxy 2-butanone 4-phosphate synthase/GTP cyclohydrolase II